MVEWRLLTNHARVLGCLAEEPDLRLRDLAAKLGTTERTAYKVVAELEADGYLSKVAVGRRNRYILHRERGLPDAILADLSIGNVLDVLGVVRPQRAGEPAVMTKRPAGTRTRK